MVPLGASSIWLLCCQCQLYRLSTPFYLKKFFVRSSVLRNIRQIVCIFNQKKHQLHENLKTTPKIIGHLVENGPKTYRQCVNNIQQVFHRWNCKKPNNWWAAFILIQSIDCSGAFRWLDHLFCSLGELVCFTFISFYKAFSHFTLHSTVWFLEILVW